MGLSKERIFKPLGMLNTAYEYAWLRCCFPEVTHIVPEKELPAISDLFASLDLDVEMLVDGREDGRFRLKHFDIFP